MRKLYRFFKISFYLLVVLGIAGLVGIYATFVYFSRDLPKINSLKDYNPPEVSQVFAEDGTLIGEFWEQRRIVLQPDEIPRLFRDAVTASEDQRFFEHSGIDYFGILRAAIDILKSGGEIKSGASTITQQVAKNFFLSNERTAARKIKEIILAKRIEDVLNKEEILYLYLNQVYLGNRSYGIEAAAENYFHKPARDLNLSEVSIIIGLFKGGDYFDLTKHFDRGKTRQEYVLSRMVETGKITPEQMEAAKNQKLTVYDAPTAEEFNERIAPWFVEEVRKMLIDKYGSEMVNTGGLKIHTTLDAKANTFAQAGLIQGLTDINKRHGYGHIVTHLEPKDYADFIQKGQKQLYREQVDPDWIPTDVTPDAIQSAIVPLKDKQIYKALITDITSSSITARVGNIEGVILKPDYGWARQHSSSKSWGGIYLPDPTKRFHKGDVIEVALKNVGEKETTQYPAGKTYFTLEETPEVEGALFCYDPQTGFVKTVIGGKDFKDSEFNRATQAKRQTGSSFKPIVYASALDKGYDPDYIVEDTPLRVPIGNGEIWEPKNAGGGYKGPMALKDALAQSRNVVSARLVLDMGVDYVTAMVRKFGITSKVAKVYSMALGSNEMRLSELARAFGVFPTGGILPNLIYVTKVVDRRDHILESATPQLVTNFVDQIKNGSFQGQGAVTLDNSRIENSLRDDLWTDAQYWVKQDRLDLSPVEKILLYGKYIPKGYVISPKTAYTMVQMMRGVIEHGTAWRVKSLGREIAGKTGTTNDNTDAWFIGFTPNLVTGVWAGYDNHTDKLGGGEEGGTAAAPIFIYFLQKYLEGTPKLSFNIPSAIESPLLARPVPVNPGQNLGKFGNLYEGGGGADIFTQDL